ncbi:MAG: AEC family transporter [Planctomycetes bacterium]|nr:AEC family transporter [Planctomycetota bacterium]
MNVFLQTFEAVAILLSIGVLGFLLIRRHVVPTHFIKIASTLALDVALPCLVSVNILTKLNTHSSPTWWQMPLWWLGFTVWAGGLTFFTSRAVRKENRREFALGMFYQNALFFPLAILTEMFGQDSIFLVNLFLFTMFFAGFVFSTYPIVFGEGIKQVDWRKCLHPVTLATIAAVILNLFGVGQHIPGFVVSALDMVGQMTVPLLMLVLGASIYIDFKGRGKVQTMQVAKFVAMKNFLFPLLTFGILIFVKPPYPVALILILQAAVPPITSAPILVGRENGNRSLASQFVFASFAFSLISIPLMMAMFNSQFGVPPP